MPLLRWTGGGKCPGKPAPHAVRAHRPAPVTPVRSGGASRCRGMPSAALPVHSRPAGTGRCAATAPPLRHLPPGHAAATAARWWCAPARCTVRYPHLRCAPAMCRHGRVHRANWPAPPRASLRAAARWAKAQSGPRTAAPASAHVPHMTGVGAKYPWFGSSASAKNACRVWLLL